MTKYDDPRKQAVYDRMRAMRDANRHLPINWPEAIAESIDAYMTAPEPEHD